MQFELPVPPAVETTTNAPEVSKVAPATSPTTFAASASHASPLLPSQSVTNVQSVSYEQFEKLLDTKLETFRTSIIEELNAILMKERASFKEQVEAIHGENERLQEEFKALEKKVLTAEVTILAEAIGDLQCQLNERDQELLSNDVEITNVPEYESESVGHLVMATATKLGMTLEERDIVSAVRVGPKRGLINGQPKPRPRPIVVRLTRRSLQEQLLKNGRVRREATTAELGLHPHEPQRFYVNERLTKVNRALFAKARDAGREARWRYILWTRDGKVYARREQSSRRILLRTDADVKAFIIA